MKTSKIEYYGATIEVVDFLPPLLPQDLPLSLWPTFCGAGEGIGDLLVPDKIGGVIVSAECLDHDISWAISPNTYAAFQAANNRFFKNIISRIFAELNGKELAKALGRCIAYWFVVSSLIGWRNFEPCGENPWTNPVVRDRLNRLARANYGLDKAN